MQSSSASSTCRIELGAPLGSGRVLLALGAAAAVALAASAMPGAAAAGAWLVAAGLCAWEWRGQRCRPHALLMQAPDAVQLLWPGREPQPARLLRHRRLGPLLVLELDAGGRLRLGCWLPGLALNDARVLSLQLARMRPGAGASV
jgi:hypothetical protein